MDCFCKAATDAHLLHHIMHIVRNTTAHRTHNKSYSKKISVFRAYLDRIMCQLAAEVLDNGLCSNHALFTVKYV